MCSKACDHSLGHSWVSWLSANSHVTLASARAQLQGSNVELAIRLLPISSLFLRMASLLARRRSGSILGSGLTKYSIRNACACPRCTASIFFVTSMRILLTENGGCVQNKSHISCSMRILRNLPINRSIRMRTEIRTVSAAESSRLPIHLHRTEVERRDC